MYRQDNYDCENYNYEESEFEREDKAQRGNDKLLNDFELVESDTYKPIKPTIDSIVGIVNLKEYVNEVIQKYMKSTLVEVPTGAIINQFCSLEKWYAQPDSGTVDDVDPDSNFYAGHRPAMMSKRDVGLVINEKNKVDNAFIQSTIMGACQKINKLINPNPKKDADIESSDDLTYNPTGFYNEIIPLYKRDYVLCDGSIYSIFPFPQNLATDSYPNRRKSLERFIDLFFAIGYQYTKSADYINKEFDYTWDDVNKVYKITNYQIIDNVRVKTIIPPHHISKYNNELGRPIFNTIRMFQYKNDIHTIFVEDFLTILAFDVIYNEYSKAYDVNFKWDFEGVCNWLKTIEIPEKYKLTSFIGDSNSFIKEQLLNGEWINKSNIEIDDNFVMDLPYYNFNNDGNRKLNENNPLPIINLGREIKTFGDVIKFYDSE